MTPEERRQAALDLPPDVLAAEIRAAIDAVTDEDALRAARALGDRERQAILDTLDGLAT